MTSYLEAGRGETPLPVIATTTHVAYSAAKRIGASLSQYAVFDPDDLSVRLNDINQDLSCQHELGDTSCDSANVVVESLSRIWATLSQLKCDIMHDACDDQSDTSSAGSRTCNVNMRAFHDPYAFFSIDDEGREADEADKASLETLLNVMVEKLKILKAKLAAGQKQYTCQQIMTDLDLFLTDESEDPAHACHLSFGLHLLMVSYEAYLTGAKQRPEGWKSAAVNPRLASLQLARTLEKELHAMLDRHDAPCCCLRIDNVPVLHELHGLRNTLHNYVRTPRFDLLVQSPWISGEHMVGNLVQSAKLGYRAWHHGYVGFR